MERTNFNTIRKNEMESRNGAPIGGKCVECGCYTTPNDGGIRVTLPSQQNGVWLCRNHRGRKNLNGYCDENPIFIGTSNSDGVTCSCELEYMGVSSHARAYLVTNGFKMTSDCTVDVEAKSPIYKSLNSYAKVLGGIEYMNNNDNYKFDVTSDEVGMHHHFGFVDNRYNLMDLAPYGMELTKALNDYVVNMDSTKRFEIFGRDFENYARPMRYNDYYGDRCDLTCVHENWINFQHSYSIEIRLFRFNNASNIAYQAKVFREIFKIWASLFTWMEKYNDDEDKIRAKASKLGDKALRVFKELENLN